MAGEATRRFRDDAGILDGGFIRASFSASGTSSGGLFDLAKFQKLIFLLGTEGIQYGNVTMAIYSISTSASSISSASSNWAQVDATNLTLSMNSSALSVSSNRYMGLIDCRAEKFQNTSNGMRYIRPVVTCGSGVSSTSVTNLYLVPIGQLPAYGTASSQESPAMGVVVELDYL